MKGAVAAAFAVASPSPADLKARVARLSLAADPTLDTINPEIMRGTWIEEIRRRKEGRQG